jgi:hypothetical protein
VSALRN